MTLFFEWLLIIGLITGVLWFFGAAEFVKDMFKFLLKLITLIGCGFFLGIGIHLANITFGW